MRSLLLDTWAVVLAAGEGRRIRELTLGPDGVSVPKQYCSFGRERCMLEWARERAVRVVPSARTLTVVASEHREHWEPLLGSTGGAIVQPRNRGTAAGILLPLLHILDRQPDALVLLLPSDHHVGHEGLLQAALEGALDQAREEDSLVLLGMTPDAADTEYGWIRPGTGAWRGVRRVLRFVEKPSAADAALLYAEGALWNTFMMAGRARTIVRLIARTLPGLVRDLREAFERGPRAVDSIYDKLVARDFSRDVLAHSVERLRVLTAPGCGWTDLGTPARLKSFLGAPVVGLSA
jgi:mannose-1-phosphate guanylyltransferase